MSTKDEQFGLGRVLRSGPAKAVLRVAFGSMHTLIPREIRNAKGQHPLLDLAANDRWWRVSGVGPVLAKFGVTQRDLIRKPDASITKLIGAITMTEAAKTVQDAVIVQLQDMLEGRSALPIDLSIIKPHHTLKHVVNDRGSKEVFRTCLPLPAVYVGQCTCCNHNGLYTTVQNLNRVPVVKNASSTLLKEVASLIGGKGSAGFMAAEAIAAFAEDEANAMLALLLDGEASHSLLVPCMVPRNNGNGKINWEMQVICGYCRFAIDDPKQAVANAHASKMINDVLYRILNIHRRDWKQISGILRGHASDRKDVKDKSDRLLSESKRVTEGHQKSAKGGIVERSQNFSKEDEDALAKELHRANFSQYVRRPKSKSGLWKLSASGRRMGVKALDRLLRVAVPTVGSETLDAALDEILLTDAVDTTVEEE